MLVNCQMYKTIQLFEKFVAQLAQKKVTQSTDSPCTDISQK